MYFMEKEDLLDIAKHSAMLYEYMDKAGPRAINGYPCFFSMRILWKENWEDLCNLIDKCEASKDAFISGEEGTA